MVGNVTDAEVHTTQSGGTTMRALATICAVGLSFTCAMSSVDAQDASYLVKQLSGTGVAGTENLPPMYSVIFTQAEFAKFIVDPAAGLERLGHKVDHVTVTIKDDVWVAKEKKWSRGLILRDLPPSQS